MLEDYIVHIVHNRSHLATAIVKASLEGIVSMT
jgi:hypothetical protein